jgi:hypothetical protein
MSSKSKPYAKQISNAQVMSTALKSNMDTLQKRGMSEEFIATLVALIDGAIAQNGEQEKLKADLKSSTAGLQTFLQQIDLMMKEAIKVVKLATPQTQWKEFGITDKR